MRLERWKEVDRGNWQALRTAGTAQAMCEDGTCKKQYFEGNADRFDSAIGFLVSHSSSQIQGRYYSSTYIFDS